MTGRSAAKVVCCSYSMFGLLLVGTIIWWLLTRALIPKPIPGIPYNLLSACMPWGELLTLGIHNFRTGGVFDWLAWQCIRRKTPITQLFIPSFSTTRPVLVVTGLPEIKDIVVRRWREFDRAPLMHDWFGLLVPNATIGKKTDTAFKKQRRLWNCILNTDFLTNVTAPAFEEPIRRLVRLWASIQVSDPAFEAVQDLRKVALEAMWMMLLGSELRLLDGPIKNSHKGRHNWKNINTSDNKTRNPFPLFYHDLEWLLRGMDWVTQGINSRFYTWIFNQIPRFQLAKSRTEHLLQTLVNIAHTNVVDDVTTTRCALTEVLQRQASLGSFDFGKSDASLIDELLELLITGHETTASATAWALKYLQDNQEIQSRLYDALKTAFPEARSTSPSVRDVFLAEVPYLDAVIAEVLRMSCTGPVSFRETTTDVQLLGHRIPAATPVILVTGLASNHVAYISSGEVENYRSKQRRTVSPRSTSEKWSVNLDYFIPERWIDQDGNFDGEAGLSLPFSAGLRGCFGRRIAILELRLMIGLLIWKFHFPKQPARLSRYGARDLLTRRPTCCYIRPVERTIEDGLK